MGRKGLVQMDPFAILLFYIYIYIYIYIFANILIYLGMHCKTLSQYVAALFIEFIIKIICCLFVYPRENKDIYLPRYILTYYV